MIQRVFEPDDQAREVGFGDVGSVPVIPVMDQGRPIRTNPLVLAHPNRGGGRIAQSRKAPTIVLVWNEVWAMVFGAVAPPCAVSLLAHRLHPKVRIAHQNHGQHMLLRYVINNCVVPSTSRILVLGPRHLTQHAIDILHL
eukprot:CAMPEP_0198118808 /NCGR_PEP_ID=MMETSP1442-20131203/23159_1 /TAXON_ID= /ORGANISM="Craspedostauros australis, Strain CCMP3328" /LENGTH=139 /DNA_ID=CAMNT_0043777129 /DNA_START=647 /DNA_END=1066 /DNA_ORIENTATION=+